MAPATGTHTVDLPTNTDGKILGETYQSGFGIELDRSR